MSLTTLAHVNDLLSRFHAPTFVEALRGDRNLINNVNKSYSGNFMPGTGSVRVQQLNPASAQVRTVGVDAEYFDTRVLDFSYIDITPRTLIQDAFEIPEIESFLAGLEAEDPMILASMRANCADAIETYLHSFVSPSSSAPDHIVTGNTDFNVSSLSAVGVLASQAKWGKDKPWFLDLGPQYYADLGNSMNNIQVSTGKDDVPLISGKKYIYRGGFNIAESNSDGLATIAPAASALAGDYGLAYHPDFLHLVMPTDPRLVEFEVVKGTSAKKNTFIVTVKFFIGAALGIDGAKKHISIYNA